MFLASYNSKFYLVLISDKYNFMTTYVNQLLLFQALLMKAEALYQKGDFESALVFFHRGNKQRPELSEFRLGIQKAQEAINNSIGGNYSSYACYKKCVVEKFY